MKNLEVEFTGRSGSSLGGKPLNRPTSKPHPRFVAVYLHSLYNGGIERVMFTLIQELLNRGIAVDLVLDFLIYSPFENLIPAGARLVKLDAHHLWQRLPRLISYLRNNNPHALLSATHFANETACVARKAARSNTRLVLSEHTNLSADIKDSKGRTRRALLPLTTRRLYPLADAIVAVSDGVREDMCRVSGLPQDRVFTIYNPIDFARLAQLAKESLDHAWFAPGAPPVIVAIGRLEAQKNFPELMRSFEQVRRQCPARLLILGEGSERGRLTELSRKLGIEKDVKLPGFVANPAAYIARAAVFAMSSSWEGMPMALIEALALGTPVVSTDCPSGPAEVLRGGEYGDLIPMGDSEALSAAILRLLGGNRKHVPPNWLRQFDSSTITDRYLEIMSGRVGPDVGKWPV